jgi:hypothetical protein
MSRLLLVLLLCVLANTIEGCWIVKTYFTVPENCDGEVDYVDGVKIEVCALKSDAESLSHVLYFDDKTKKLHEKVYTNPSCAEPGIYNTTGIPLKLYGQNSKPFPGTLGDCVKGASGSNAHKFYVTDDIFWSTWPVIKQWTRGSCQYLGRERAGVLAEAPLQYEIFRAYNPGCVVGHNENQKKSSSSWHLDLADNKIYKEKWTNVNCDGGSLSQSGHINNFFSCQSFGENSQGLGAAEYRDLENNFGAGAGGSPKVTRKVTATVGIVVAVLCTIMIILGVLYYYFVCVPAARKVQAQIELQTATETINPVSSRPSPSGKMRAKSSSNVVAPPAPPDIDMPSVVDKVPPPGDTDPNEEV